MVVPTYRAMRWMTLVAALGLCAILVCFLVLRSGPIKSRIYGDDTAVVGTICTHRMRYGRYPFSFEYGLVMVGTPYTNYRKIGECLYKTPSHGAFFTYYLEENTELPVLILHGEDKPDICSHPSNREGYRVPLKDMGGPQSEKSQK